MPFIVGILGLVVIGFIIKFWWLLLAIGVLWALGRAWWRSDSQRHARARRDIRATTRATERQMRNVDRTYDRSGRR